MERTSSWAVWWVMAAALALAGAACDGSASSGQGALSTDTPHPATGAGAGPSGGPGAGPSTGAGRSEGPGAGPSTGAGPSEGTGGASTATDSHLHGGTNVLANGDAACPWDAAQTCMVLGPTPLEAVKKAALMATPTSKEIGRIGKITSHFPAKVGTLPHGVPGRLAPTSTSAPASPPKPPATAAAAPSVVAPSLPRLPGTLAVPTGLAPPGTVHGVGTIVPRQPGLASTLLVRPGDCGPGKMFLCRHDAILMKSGTVSTVDIALLDFIDEYDKCAPAKGLRSFLDLLRDATIAVLLDRGYGKGSPAVAATPPEVSIEAWKGPTAGREVEFFVRQTAQEDGILHALYLPESKVPSYRNELQDLIDRVRTAADKMLIQLVVKSECPPAR